MRLEVTRRSDLALKVLRELNEATSTVSGRFLAERLDISPTYLAEVVAPLAAMGWVLSRSGPTGGYGAAPGLGSVSVLEVVEAVEGPFVSSTCVLAGGPCGGEQVCALHHAWARARQAFREALAAVPAVGA